MPLVTTRPEKVCLIYRLKFHKHQAVESNFSDTRIQHVSVVLFHNGNQNLLFL